MNIIIVGQGKFGLTLTKQLSKEGHDLVIIDRNNDVVTKIVDECDVMGICGNGANCDILKEAGADKAKVLIATTSSDELNILCCMFAKKLGTQHTIARVRNPDYAAQSVFLREKIGINMTVNPEFATADEISRIIRFPSAANLDSFAKGKVDIASVKVPEGNPICSMAISDMKKKCKANILICAVQRGDKVFIPSGSFVVEKGDIISITGNRSAIGTFLKQIGIYKRKIHDVMIIGGGRIGYYLANMLAETGRNIKLVEQNYDKCIELSNALSDVTVIHGDGTDQDLLDEQGLESQDAFVSLTGIDEENVIVSMYAASKNIKKVITKVDRHSYSIINSMGLETMVSPSIVAGSLVTRYIRALQNSDQKARIQTLYKLLGGKVEASEFIVPEDTAYENVPFRELSILPNTLVVCIIRNGRIIFPGGEDFMKRRDSVIVVTAGRIIEDLQDIFM